MPRKKKTGVCHICGNYGKLSFEHVPPQKAFNSSRRVVIVGFDNMVSLGPDDVPKGPIQQRGAGDHTLCESCNNTTGTWYAADFIQWCYQGMDVLQRTNFNPSIFIFHHLYPLRILKQIVTMLFSVNDQDKFRQAFPELAEFVLNKEKRYLPPRFRFFTYFNPGDRFRYNGLSSKIDLETGRVTALTEISYPPFGYVMTLDTDPPDRRLLEISHFARYRYNDFRSMELKPPVLPTATYWPGDYRTRKEVREQAAESSAYQQDWIDHP